MMDLDAWHRGRVVLLGDAAHAAPPHMGEAGSLAVEDAQVLAETLRVETSIEAALVAYEKRRRPRVSWVRDQSLTVNQTWTLPPDARDAALRAAGDQMLRDRYTPLRAEP
jgi:2-polyprenyl-6-methoxyphenol hydroxylase-like FAD-dependent oxidoreductase